MISRFFCSVFLFFPFLASSQYYMLQGIDAASPVVSPAYHTEDKTGGQMQLNYDLSDEIIFTPAAYHRLLWPIHRKYLTAGQDSQLVYAVAAFDSLISSDNSFSGSFKAVVDGRIDSIGILFGHENASGLADTVFFSLWGLDTNGYPTQNQLWADTMVLSTGTSPGNQWTNTVDTAWNVDIALDTAQLFAVKIEYSGALADTFGLVAGYGFSGACAGSGTDKAELSHFYPNSMAYWTGFNLQLPSSGGGDIYLDCNGNVLFDAGIDSRNLIQNWAVSAWVSAPDLAVVMPEVPELRVFPNPARSFVQVSSPVNLAIEGAALSDLSGKFVNVNAWDGASQTLSWKNLASGIYILHVQTSYGPIWEKIYVEGN